MHESVNSANKFYLYDLYPQKEQGAIEHTKKTLKTLDDYLSDHTFLVGDTITLADIVAACDLYLGMTKVRKRHIVVFGPNCFARSNPLFIFQYK